MIPAMIGFFSIVSTVFKTLSSLFGLIRGVPTVDKVQEDKELAEAIKNGDAEKVAKIRERRRNYLGLFLLIAMLMLVGCLGRGYSNVPLTSGVVAYQIPAGEYIDSKGNKHIETNARWSVSEEDLFNNTRELSNKKWYQKSEYTTLGLLIIILVVVLVIPTRRK